MSGTHTAEDYAALVRQNESLSRTTVNLTDTLRRQNDLIERLLADATSSKRPPDTYRETSFGAPPPPPQSSSNFGHTSSLPSSHLASGMTTPLRSPSIPQHIAPKIAPRASPTQSQTAASSSTLQSPPLTIIQLPSTISVPLPFPRLGGQLVFKLLRWWWYPNHHHGMSKPLREWTKEDRRYCNAAWSQAETVARGWHIMKGHTLMASPLHQLEKPQLSNIMAESVAWKKMWGGSVSQGVVKIRDYIRDHQPPYYWARTYKPRLGPDGDSEEPVEEGEVAEEAEGEVEDAQPVKKSKIYAEAINWT